VEIANFWRAGTKYAVSCLQYGGQAWELGLEISVLDVFWRSGDPQPNMREGTTYMHMAAFRSLNYTFLERYGRIEFCLGRFYIQNTRTSRFARAMARCIRAQLVRNRKPAP